MTLRGIDVSKWQPTTPSLTGRSFLIARASVGLDRDEKYAMHIANARKAGLVVGAYAFGYTHLGIEAQAETFLAAAGDVDLYAFDVEGDRAPTRSQTQRFIDRVRAADKRCGLYMSEAPFYRDIDADWWWVAKWSTTPPKRYDIWQYRGSPLDLDRFEGTRDQLLALGLPPAPDTGVEPTMIVPQQLEHVVVSASVAHIYSAPDLGAQTPTTLPKGRRLRKFGGVTGWQFVQVNYGGIQQYVWVKSDDVDPDPEPLTVHDGDPCADLEAANESLTDRLLEQTARANAAENKVARAKTALGCS